MSRARHAPPTDGVAWPLARRRASSARGSKYPAQPEALCDLHYAVRFVSSAQ